MERKTVKIRVDMYSDTKFKIIDTMEDRDLIHYIWTRLLTLAGKVNLEGELYLSKNIAYSIETLALEFNRSAKKVALALKVFMDLEMVELTKNNVYKVRNFSKHQNIKKKKKDINKDKLEAVDSEKVFVDKCDNIILNNEVIDNEKSKFKGFVTSEGEKSNITNSMINKKENEYKEPDLFKRDFEKNKFLNDDFIISNDNKCNDINVAVDSDVEKFKKDSNFKVVDFNSNNKIKNDDNYVNQNNNMKDNNAKDKIKIQNKNILDKASLNKSEDTNNADVLKNKVYIVNKEHESYENNKFHESINIENKNDTADLKGNNARNYITENKENNNEVAFSEDKKTADKDILDNEFVFSKAKCKKKKSNSKSKKKKNDVDEIICDLEDEYEEAEICEFTDEPPKGNVIATFEF